MTIRRIVIELDDEDRENLPVALGFAIGCVSVSQQSAENRELATRVIRRLHALFEALRDGHEP